MTTTNTEPDEGVLRKVRGLLSQAEHPNTDPVEAEAFRAKAEAMMAKYCLDATILGHYGSSGPREPGSRVIEVHAPYAGEKGSLVAAICSHFECRAIWMDSRLHKGVRRIHVFGMPEALEAVEMTFTSLSLQMVRDLPHKRDYLDDSSGMALWSARQSFIHGFARKVADRFAEQKRAARREADETHGAASVAVALRDEAALVADAFRAQYPSTRSSGRGGRVHDSSAFAAGQAAGARADLGGRRVSASNRGALGR